MLYSLITLIRLSEYATFKGLRESIGKDLSSWEQLYSSDSPHTMKLPKAWEKLNDFHKILILRCFRADKLVPAIQGFVSGEYLDFQKLNH